MAIYAFYYSMIPLPLIEEKTAEKKPAQVCFIQNRRRIYKSAAQ